MNCPCTCETCGCWSQFPGTGRGMCRNHSPAVDADHRFPADGLWPETHMDDWCGDHTALRPADLPGPNRGMR